MANRKLLNYLLPFFTVNTITAARAATNTTATLIAATSVFTHIKNKSGEAATSPELIKDFNCGYPRSFKNVFTLFSTMPVTSSKDFWPAKYAGISSLIIIATDGSKDPVRVHLAIRSL